MVDETYMFKTGLARRSCSWVLIFCKFHPMHSLKYVGGRIHLFSWHIEMMKMLKTRHLAELFMDSLLFFLSTLQLLILFSSRDP